MAWFYLFIAGVLEIVWAYAMKKSMGFTVLAPSEITIVAMIASFALLSLAMKTLPLGTAYTIWRIRRRHSFPRRGRYTGPDHRGASDRERDRHDETRQPLITPIRRFHQPEAGRGEWRRDPTDSAPRPGQLKIENASQINGHAVTGPMICPASECPRP